MKLLIVLLTSAMSFVACTSNPVQVVTCPIETSLNADVASAIASYCSNSAAVSAQLTAWEAPLNLCPAASNKVKGVLGDACLAIIPIAEEAANQVAILQTLGCDLTKVQSVTDLLTKACGLIPNAKKMHLHTPFHKGS